MKPFYHLLANTVVAAVINNFVWFVLTFWIYLETRSVVATSVIGGMYLVINMATGFWFGSLVDHSERRRIMAASSATSLILYGAGLLFYLVTPAEAFTYVESVRLWVLVGILMVGVVMGNIRHIALMTSVTLLVPEDRRDRANGLVGSMMGIAFSITSFASGAMLAYTGLRGSLILAIVCTGLAILHLALLRNVPKLIASAEDGHEPEPRKVDIKGTIRVIAAVPGLFALIFFATFNNFLGGVFMALMDAYGLSLVSVQTWGVLWGFISLGLIVGGLIVAKRGLGSQPLRTLLVVNAVVWFVCMTFAVQPWISLLVLGMVIHMVLVPFAEAAEQTILQKVVPVKRQGRVFGFAQSLESAASPISAFLIGPIAQWVFIPFMTTGAGVELIGDWYGTGQGRGIALVFTLAGVIGLAVTLLALRSRPYRLLSKTFAKKPEALQPLATQEAVQA